MTVGRRSAPTVTSSPWAKLVSPVVPKMSDSPIAPIAMMRPNCRPSTNSWQAVELGLHVVSRVPSPRGNSTVRCARPDRHLADLTAVLADGDALGQRVLVEGDGVVAGPGQRDEKAPSSSRLGLADLIAVLLDDDRDALETARRR